jgi:hypothetical protein
MCEAGGWTIRSCNLIHVTLAHKGCKGEPSPKGRDSVRFRPGCSMSSWTIYRPLILIKPPDHKLDSHTTFTPNSTAFNAFQVQHQARPTHTEPTTELPPTVMEAGRCQLAQSSGQPSCARSRLLAKPSGRVSKLPLPKCLL